MRQVHSAYGKSSCPIISVIFFFLRNMHELEFHAHLHLRAEMDRYAYKYTLHTSPWGLSIKEQRRSCSNLSPSQHTAHPWQVKTSEHHQRHQSLKDTMYGWTPQFLHLSSLDCDIWYRPLPIVLPLSSNSIRMGDYYSVALVCVCAFKWMCSVNAALSRCQRHLAKL